jgi:hypothetical protein
MGLVPASMRRRLIVASLTVAAVSLVAPSCSHHAGGTLITGTLLVKGDDVGPPLHGLPDATIPGEVVASSPSRKATVRSSVGPNGRFRVRLPPGVYLLHDAKPPLTHVYYPGSGNTAAIPGACRDETISVQSSPISVTLVCRVVTGH